MTQRILGLSGRKQSGKNTATNFITGLELMSVGVVRSAFFIDEQGQLQIGDLFGNEEYSGHLDLNRTNPEFVSFLEEHVNPYVKVYSFADLLKKDVCIKILGLTHEQCYGTDDDKNTLTSLLWENMPGVTVVPLSPEKSEVRDMLWSLSEGYTEQKNGIFEVEGRLGHYYTKIHGVVHHTPGPMSAREVLQYVGTDIFRKMYSNVWVDALIRQIKKEDSSYALICDVRFPNEVEGVQAAGGKVVRLTRNPSGNSDAHSSETALDKENFDWSKFDFVLDNADMSINEQNKALHTQLVEWGWAPGLEYGEAVS
jgi:hypothetical protein